MGSQSKLGVDFPVKAYKLSENRYTLEDIKASIPSCKVDLAPLYEKPRRKSTVTLEEAKELYPEWYEKRIVQGEPKQKSKKQGGTWVCNEALYEWWKRKITEEVKAGGRYFSIMALCSYGLKCGISEQKIRRDAYAFLDHLESLTEDEDNHFQPGRCERRYKEAKDDLFLWYFEILEKNEIKIYPKKMTYNQMMEECKKNDIYIIKPLYSLGYTYNNNREDFKNYN